MTPYEIRNKNRLDNLCRRYGMEFIAQLMIDHPKATCDDLEVIADEITRRGEAMELGENNGINDFGILDNEPLGVQYSN